MVSVMAINPIPEHLLLFLSIILCSYSTRLVYLEFTKLTNMKTFWRHEAHIVLMVNGTSKINLCTVHLSIITDCFRLKPEGCSLVYCGLEVGSYNFLRHCFEKYKLCIKRLQTENVEINNKMIPRWKLQNSVGKRQVRKTTQNV